MKHPKKDDASAEEGEIVEVEMEEEVTNSSRRSYNEEEHACTNDVNSNHDNICEDFEDQAADDPGEVDEQTGVKENQSKGRRPNKKNVFKQALPR